MARNGITSRRSFHQIWIASKYLLWNEHLDHNYTSHITQIRGWKLLLMPQHNIPLKGAINSKPCRVENSGGNSSSWWRHQMEKISALLAFCAGNSPVTGEFPPQRPVTRSFDIFFEIRMNKQLSKQSRRWWFETSSRSLWRHCDVSTTYLIEFNWIPNVVSVSAIAQKISSDQQLRLTHLTYKRKEMNYHM